MKNLFAINRTDNEEATDLDQNPFVAAHVSDEVRYKLDHAFDDPEAEPVPEPDSEEVAAQKRIIRRNWIIFGVMFGVALLLSLLDRIQPESDNALSPLLDVAIILMIASLFFYYKAKRMSNKLRSTAIPTRDTDIEAATARLTEAAELASDELGVPKGATALEVLPYHYRIKDGEAVPAAKKGHFDNIATSAWVDGGDLCLATAQELFRVPLAAMRGYRAVDEVYQIDFWLKDEEPDDEKYKEFEIRRAGYLGKKCRWYYVVEIEGDYEMWIPGYDWAVLTGLVSLQEL